MLMSTIENDNNNRQKGVTATITQEDGGIGLRRMAPMGESKWQQQQCQRMVASDEGEQ